MESMGLPMGFRVMAAGSVSANHADDNIVGTAVEPLLMDSNSAYIY